MAAQTPFLETEEWDHSLALRDSPMFRFKQAGLTDPALCFELGIKSRESSQGIITVSPTWRQEARIHSVLTSLLKYTGGNCKHYKCRCADIRTGEQWRPHPMFKFGLLLPLWKAFVCLMLNTNTIKPMYKNNRHEKEKNTRVQNIVFQHCSMSWFQRTNPISPMR